MEPGRLAEKLREKYPKLKDEPMLDDLVFAAEGDMEEELPLEDEMLEEDVELEAGDEEMLEGYEPEDELMLDDELEEEEDFGPLANSPMMEGEEGSKKKDFKRRMALRKALGGK